MKRNAARLLLAGMLCAAATLPLLTGCNDDDPPAPARFTQGGAVQGIPLALTTETDTFAGNGSWGGADNDNGALATFAEPYGVTTDGINLYITEKSGDRVRRIAIATGAVTTIVPAGTLSEPTGITTDGTSLYVCDSQNNRICKVSLADNAVTVVAGTGTAGYADNDNGALAQFNDPYGITTDGTNLYVADRRNHVIRKIVLATGKVTTIAGQAGFSGAANNDNGLLAGFDMPMAITTDGSFLYVGDWDNFLVRKVSLTAPHAVTTLAGTAGVPGDNAATLYGPRGLTTDGTNLYVADFYMQHNGTAIPGEPAEGSSLIRKIVLATGVLTTVAGTDNSYGFTDNVAGTSAKFEQPSGISTDGFSLFVADRMNAAIRRIR